MRANLTSTEWSEYIDEEMPNLRSILSEIGFELDIKQIHIGGERYLMSGKKLVLTGTRCADGIPVIIKASSTPEGKSEIVNEHDAQQTLQNLAFANDEMYSPMILYYGKKSSFTILVTAFIEQEMVFNARPIKEQFFFALRALEMQEGFHATAYNHLKEINKIFPLWCSEDYVREFKKFKDTIVNSRQNDTALLNTLESAVHFLDTHKVTIDRYSPYLAHTDLVPHNMRISNRKIFLLDYASFHFGNKYESWARFLNFMLIHSPQIERMLTIYVCKNRSADECLALRLMRIYKIGFLLSYYAKALEKTDGDLHILTKERISLWHEALKALLADTPLSEDIVLSYKQARGTLRSEEEKERQKDISL